MKNKLVIIDGTPYVKVGKHRIHQDLDYDNTFVLEQFEFNSDGIDMFSVVDGYPNLIDAINAAKRIK